MLQHVTLCSMLFLLTVMQRSRLSSSCMPQSRHCSAAACHLATSSRLYGSLVDMLHMQNARWPGACWKHCSQHRPRVCRGMQKQC